MSSDLRLAQLNDSVPHARLLSNGHYAVLLTSAGSGFSSWNGQALTAWGGQYTRASMWVIQALA